jgi:hypothetical protein
MLDNQLDWECWPVDDILEDFGQDVDDEVDVEL